MGAYSNSDLKRAEAALNDCARVFVRTGVNHGIVEMTARFYEVLADVAWQNYLIETEASAVIFREKQYEKKRH